MRNELHQLHQLEVGNICRKNYHFDAYNILIQAIHLDIIHLGRCILHLEIVCNLSHECYQWSPSPSVKCSIVNLVNGAYLQVTLLP